MYHVIVNPKSRTGLGKKIWKQAEQILVQEEQEFKVHYTRHPWHGRDIARELTGESWKPEDVLVIIGGDGTINEVVNGIEELSKVTIGYIPTGSGNDFARSLGISTDPEEGLRNILKHEREHVIDVGVNRSGDTPRRFVNSTGMGWDAGICFEVAESNLKNILNRLKLGKLTYIVIAIKQLAAFKSQTLTVEMEGEEPREFDDAYFAVAMNLPYEGGGCKFAPDALVDDGELDILVASHLPKWKVFLILPFALKGKHTKFKEVTMLRGKSVTISAERKTPVHLDGELGGFRKKMQVSMEGEQLKVIY